MTAASEEDIAKSKRKIECRRRKHGGTEEIPSGTEKTGFSARTGSKTFMQRYAGKPFLRLLECYVLQSIGELSADDESKLTAMTPKLRELYKREGTWQEIVAGEMKFLPELPQQINTIWLGNKERAASADVAILAEDFAKAFVDQNFI